MSLEEGRKQTNEQKKKKNHNKNIKPKMFHKREKNKIKSNYQRRSPIGQNPPRSESVDRMGTSPAPERSETQVSS